MLLLKRTPLQQIKKEVSRELYARVSKFLNTPKVGRFKPEDADKELELDICKELFGSDNEIIPPYTLVEEFAEIDAYINGEGVQIKCRNDSNFLTLEDYKTKKNGERTSWVDRNDAQYTIFVSTSYEPCLIYSIYETSDLKRLLKHLRSTKNGETMNTRDFVWLNTYFRNWEYYQYNVMNKDTTIESAIYKVLI